MDTIIRNGKLVIPKVGIVDGDIAIENGKIAAILSPGAACEAETVIDASGKYLVPGLVFAWACDHSGTRWTSILLHATVNALALWAIVG